MSLACHCCYERLIGSSLPSILVILFNYLLVSPPRYMEKRKRVSAEFHSGSIALHNFVSSPAVS